MAEPFRLYYITDRAALAGGERNQRIRLLEKIAEAASEGVDYIQLREKNLCARDLESLARETMLVIRENNKLSGENGQPVTALLLNSRTDVALAAWADGVHLPADDVSAQDVSKAWSSAEKAKPRTDPIVSLACHSVEEVQQAVVVGATLAVFGPVFEKKDAPVVGATGLETLKQVCLARIPVLALGGVNMQNAESCRGVGAAGIAGIRLFQENNIGQVVRALRGLRSG